MGRFPRRKFLIGAAASALLLPSQICAQAEGISGGLSIGGTDGINNSGAPSSVLPPAVSGLQLWLKADAGVYSDAGTTLATNGQTVQQWNDQSGNGRHATQATSGNRPTYNTGKFNSLPALTFAGANNTIGTYLNSAYLGEPVTIFIVHCLLSGASGVQTYDNPLLGADSSNAGGSGAYYLKGTGGLGGSANETCGPAAWFRCNTAGSFSNTSAMSTAVDVLDILAIRNSATAPQLYRQNVPGPVNTPTGTASNITAAYIGAESFPSGTIYQTCNGNICEVVIYNRALTNNEYNKVLAGLQNKWGITYSGSYYYPCFLRNPVSNFEVHTALYLFQSPDLVNWKYRPVNCLPSAANAAANNSLRDFDILLASESTNTGGLHWLCACTYAPAVIPSHTFDIYSSSDLYSWTYVATVDVSAYTGTGADSAIVNPAWFVDSDSSIHIVCGARNNLTFDTILEVHPTNAPTMTAWSAPVDVLVGSTGFGAGVNANVNGPNITKVASTYYMDFTNGTSGELQIASSTALTSGWATITTGDWAGWHASIGNCEQSSRTLVGSTWYIFMDNPAGPQGASYATSLAIPGVPSNPPVKLNTSLVNNCTMADGNIVP